MTSAEIAARFGVSERVVEADISEALFQRRPSQMAPPEISGGTFIYARLVKYTIPY